MSVAADSGTKYDRLLSWVRLDWPLDWHSIFGREAPLRLEMGFGNGEYLAARAAEEPEVDWVGAEISWGSVRRLLGRLEHLEIDNVRVVQGDGAFLLRKLFPENSLNRVVINHSDPWPKKRHWDRRLIQSGLVADLSERLETGGELRIATDHSEYAGWISEILEGQTDLQSVHPTAWIDHPTPVPETKYMKKGIESGALIHYFVWKKINDVSGGTSKRERLTDMPNVLMEGEVSIPEVFAEFEPVSWERDHPSGPVFLHLSRVFENLGGDAWLVEARIKEDGFEQHFAVSVTRRSDGKIVVKPASLGAPRPTWGVKQAVGEVTRMLMEKSPGLRVLASSVGRNLALRALPPQ